MRGGVEQLDYNTHTDAHIRANEVTLDSGKNIRLTATPVDADSVKGENRSQQRGGRKQVKKGQHG